MYQDPDVAYPEDVPENHQRQVLMLTLWCGDGVHEWWTIEGLMRHVADPVATLDAMADLADAGLIHRQGDFVLPTRPARHYHDLFG